MKEILQDLCFQNMFDSSIMSLRAEFQGVKLIGPVTNEPLMKGNNLATLNTILSIMQQEQDSLEACPAIKLLEFPATIIPVSPSTFYDHSCWCAIFSRKD